MRFLTAMAVGLLPWSGLTDVPAEFADGIDSDSGGTITGSGTIGIANGGVGTDQINPRKVQARITGTRAIGEYLRGINADGSVACGSMQAFLASATASDRSSDLEARGAPHAPLADAAKASINATVKGAGFAVPRHVIAGGGGRSTGAAFAITGTIGQADADPLQPSSGGVFAITGGFWPGQSFAAVPEDRLFANGFEAQLP